MAQLSLLKTITIVIVTIVTIQTNVLPDALG